MPRTPSPPPAPSRSVPWAPASLLLLVLAACGEGAGDAEWAGTVQDSAGVQIVDNPAQGVWSGDDGWTLEEELRIGVMDGDPDLQFGSITGLDAGPDGEIYVLDAQAQNVRVFDAGGTLLRAFGRAGQGPGELSPQLMGLFLTGGESLVVPDMMNQRLSLFTLEGDPAGSVPLDLTSGIPMMFGAGPDGTLYQHVRRMTLPGMEEVEGGPIDLLYALADDGTVADTVARLSPGETFSFGGGEGSLPTIRIFAPENLWTVLDGGRVVSAKNSVYTLEVRDAQGDLTTILRRASSRRPMEPGEQEAFRGGMRQAWEDAGMPPAMAAQMENQIQFEETWPALAALLAGPEGSLWVQRVDPDMDLDPSAFADLQNLQVGSPAWDVFDRDGRYLGILEMPEGFVPRRVVGEAVYGVHTDDLGVSRIVRLRLIRGETT